jgi:sigma-B regulation protein RsbQ
MNVIKRHNVKIIGSGERTLVFLHGYGCSQKMWERITPSLDKDFKIILLDLVGSGESETALYDKAKYDSLEGHAGDIIEVLDQLEMGKVTLVGHSVSAVISLLAAIKRPDAFEQLVLVAPSPCYINQENYLGGFGRETIEELIRSLESNFTGWASAIAPVLTGNDPEQGKVIAESFCHTKPHIAKHFARVTFTSDHRSDLPKVRVPSIILQCSDDVIAPEAVGEYMQQHLRDSKLIRLKANGHCPHLTHPDEVVEVLHSVLKAA